MMSVLSINTDIFCYMGSACLTLVYIPLVYRVHLTKLTDALSTPTLILQILTSILFIIYRVGLPSYPIIIANTSSLTCSLYLTYAKCRYPGQLPDI